VIFTPVSSEIVVTAFFPGMKPADIEELVTRKLDYLEPYLPIGYELEYATFQPDRVETAVAGGLSNVYQTLVIVLVVVMLFLGVRTGLIVGSFVPMTIVP
jgi:multidrug efflux pump subunit AcrB